MPQSTELPPMVSGATNHHHQHHRTSSTSWRSLARGPAEPGAHPMQFSSVLLKAHASAADPFQEVRTSSQPPGPVSPKRRKTPDPSLPRPVLTMRTCYLQFETSRIRRKTQFCRILYWGPPGPLPGDVILGNCVSVGYLPCETSRIRRKT